MDRVVHILHLPPDVDRADVTYAGRAMPRYRMARSIYANPYRITATCTRDQSLAQFEDWLPLHPEVIAALRAIPLDEPVVFGCFCKWPDPTTRCHCDTYVAMRERWREYEALMEGEA